MRKLTLALLTCLTFLAPALLPGCSTLGVPEPVTLNQRLAVALGSVTAVRDSALTLLKAGRISPQDAANVNAQADNARAAIDLARSVAATDPKLAQDKLAQAVTVLRALETYLAQRKGSP